MAKRPAEVKSRRRYVGDCVSRFGVVRPGMFVFFSNRLGCLGSLLVSTGITLVLLLIFGVIGR